MGLAERRVAKEFETQKLPGLQQELDAAAGIAVPLEVDWESLSIDGQSHLFMESWEKVYFRPLIGAIKQIAADSIGADAIKAALKKVVIHNKSGIYSADRWAKFAGGTLTLDHEPTSNADYVDDRKNGLVAELEKNL